MFTKGSPAAAGGPENWTAGTADGNASDSPNSVPEPESVAGATKRIGVLDFGRRIAVGTPAEIKANPVVIEAYLGTPDDEAYDA